MVTEKRIDPLMDLAFKKVLGSEANKDILAGLIEDFFGIQPKEITIMHPYDIKVYSEKLKEANGDFSVLRQTLADVGAWLDMADFTAELQVRDAKSYDKRSLYYLCSRFCSNYNIAYPNGRIDELKDRIDELSDRDKYDSLRPVYALNILKYKHFKDEDAMRIYELHDPARTISFDPGYLKAGYFELVKTKGIEGNTRHWKDYFLGNELAADAPEHIRKAQGLIKYVNLTKEERNVIDMATKLEDKYRDEMNTAISMGLERGRSEGLAAGRSEGFIEALKAAEEIGFTAEQLLALKKALGK